GVAHDVHRLVRLPFVLPFPAIKEGVLRQSFSGQSDRRRGGLSRRLSGGLGGPVTAGGLRSNCEDGKRRGSAEQNQRSEQAMTLQSHAHCDWTSSFFRPSENLARNPSLGAQAEMFGF